VEFEFGPVNGSNNAFSIASLQAVKMIMRFWKPMNESGNNYTTIVGYANRRSGFATPEANVMAADDDDEDDNLNNFRSEAQFVFAYEHIPDEGEEDDEDEEDE
jgi:hypothetical protein